MRNSQSPILDANLQAQTHGIKAGGNNINLHLKNNFITNSAKQSYPGSKAQTALSQQFNTITATNNASGAAKNQRNNTTIDNAIGGSASVDRRAGG